MTATPIPRSLCMTCYADLDLSVLRERPAGRRPVKTVLVPAKRRPGTLDVVRRELRRGRQAYFVYPLIEESENLDLPAAVEAHRQLSEEVFPEFSVGLVHGRLAADEKEAVLQRFRDGEIRVLVTTVVVEVGIDVANATVLYIENASRFGLAQLHQLRGRVGRGDKGGTCYVGLDGAGKDVIERLKVFARTSDGFELAAADLRLRGPGDYLGLRQSGRPDSRLGNPLEDLEGFLQVRKLAEDFWAQPRSRPYRERWAGLLGAGEAEEGFVGLD